MKTVWLAAGLAAGYVLGTRAGREKYDQIVETARGLAKQPAVVEAQETVQEMAARGRDAVATKVNSTLDNVVAKMPKLSDSDTVSAR